MRAGRLERCGGASALAVRVVAGTAEDDLTLAAGRGPEDALGPVVVDLAESVALDVLAVDVHAAGVSFPEVLQTRGQYQFKPDVPFVPGSEVGGIARESGKRVAAWAFEAEFDTATLRSNDFELEWPPRSGRRQRFPEVDRAAWCARAEAESKLNPAQIPLLVRLFEALEKSSE